MRAISILYHDVVSQDRFESSGFPGPDAARYKLRLEEFEEHLMAMARAVSSKPASVLDLLRKTQMQLPLLLTFDDGGSSAAHIGDMLESLGWRAHFFIPTDYIGARTFLNKEQIRALLRRRHVIGTHSCSHPERMSHCHWEKLVEEWSRSVEVLGSILGEPVRVASVPGGHYSKKVAEAASFAGIKALFNSEPTEKCYYVGECLVLGRYTIQRGMAPKIAAGIASGQRLPRLKQLLFWNLKKVAKVLGGGSYLKTRRFILGKR